MKIANQFVFSEKNVSLPSNYAHHYITKDLKILDFSEGTQIEDSKDSLIVNDLCKSVFEFDTPKTKK